MASKKTLDYFIGKSKKVHGDKYDYSKSIYVIVLKIILIY